MRFSFIHAADIHLDSPLRGLVRRGESANPFIQASRLAFENLVKVALDRSVAFVLIAGDLYDGDWRDWASGQFVVKQLSRLDRAGILVFTIRGNHDAQSVISKDLPLPKNVTELSVRSVQSIPLKQLDTVIHGRGFATRHVDENVVTAYPQATPGYFNIGMLHTSLTGRDGHGVYAPCSLDDLKDKGYQYWALGHIHQREVLSVDPHVVFPGNIQGRHAKETGAKGITVVTVEDGRVVEVEHVVTDVARFDTRDVDLEGASDRADLVERITGVAKTAVVDAEDRPLALRLRLVGNTALKGLVAADPETLREEIQSMAWAVSETLLVERVEDATSDPAQGTKTPPIPHFDDILRECAGDPIFLASLQETLKDLRGKLPPEVLDLMEHGTGTAEAHVADSVAAAERSVFALIGMEGAR